MTFSGNVVTFVGDYDYMIDFVTFVCTNIAYLEESIHVSVRPEPSVVPEGNVCITVMLTVWYGIVSFVQYCIPHFRGDNANCLYPERL